MTVDNTTAAVAAAPEGVADVLEERLIDAEYKIWKKNTPYLYDFVMTHSLEWPSLTCQWLPTTRKIGDKAVEHSLLLGTHTTGEQNYLMVANCVMPTPDDVVEASQNSAAQADYDEEKNEVGGFGHHPNSNVGKIEIKMKVKHEGEVNRARHMPQNHFVVATRGPSSEVYVWDLSKHPSFPTESAPFSPQGVCMGHSKEGYGLVWSPHDSQKGYLLSGSEDTTLCLWNCESLLGKSAPSQPGTQIQPTSVFKGHTDVVEDVDWHAKDPNMIGSVGDDRTIRLWDIRKPNEGPSHTVNNAHEGDVNCLAFNPEKEFLMATGSADKTVAVWDMRNLSSYVQDLLFILFVYYDYYTFFCTLNSHKIVQCICTTTHHSKMHTLTGHTDQVYMVEWAPHNESILASCSADRRVGLWDLSRIGQEQSPEDAEDGPPELLFLHGGHTSKISDFSWNRKYEWTVASVSEDNVLQVWNMAEEIYAADDDEEEEQSTGRGEDGVLGEDELE